jgi:hypothetical protein
MAQPLRKPEEFPDNSDEARDQTAEYDRQIPAETETHDTERESHATLGEDIRARVKHVHKGDVGMPGTNEEIFQGSKGKELK